MSNRIIRFKCNSCIINVLIYRNPPPIEKNQTICFWFCESRDWQTTDKYTLQSAKMSVSKISGLQIIHFQPRTESTISLTLLCFVAHRSHSSAGHFINIFSNRLKKDQDVVARQGSCHLEAQLTGCDASSPGSKWNIYPECYWQVNIFLFICPSLFVNLCNDEWLNWKFPFWRNYYSVISALNLLTWVSPVAD